MRDAANRVLLAILLITLAHGTNRMTHAEETDPLRPPAIETENVPIVPQEVADTLVQYQNVRGAGMAGWDPAGKGILIRTRFGNLVQLHRVYEPGGRREQITFFEEPVRGGFIPETKTEELLLSMSEGGNENYQIYYLDRRENELKRLTDGESRNSIGPIREDGREMIIRSNQRNKRDTDLYLADPRGERPMKMLYEVDGEHWYGTDWSADDTTLLMVRFVSANEAYPATFDIASKKRSDLALPAEGKAAIGAFAFAPDGKSALIATDAGGEFLHLALLDLATKKYEWLTKDIPWNVEDLVVHRETGRAVFTVNEDGATKMYLLTFDESGKPKRSDIDLPLGIVNSLEFSPDGSKLGFSFSRPDAPPDVYSLDLKTGKLTRWTYSEVGGLDTSKFITPERISVKSFDGLKVPAYFFKPRGASADKPAPVVIRIHGGPESQYRPYFSPTTQYYLNELGVAVLVPNVRGSSGYGKTYLTLDNGMKREDSVRDIGALLDWIDKQPELDASRVAVTGGSYGGYMVLASLIHYPTRIKAGIDIVGIANFITFLERTKAYRRDLRRVEYGDERDPEMRAFFERINPTSNADKIRSALLVVHGVNDPRVPFFEAKQIAKAVADYKGTVWTVYAENEGHGFAKKENRDYLGAVEVMFLERFLMDEKTSTD
ncbi:MAG: S9 family peptidase [Pirellulales bacterium]|nr:S9 family peptidase [Pirellulales bacterium]